MSTAPVPLQNAKQRILDSPAPILLLDTCCLLDILRAAYRDGVSARIIPAAQHLLHLSSVVPKHLWLVAAEQVTTEFRRHQQEEASRCFNAAEQAEKLSSKIISGIKHLGSMNSVAVLQISSHELEKKLTDVCEDILANALVIQTDDLCLQLASRRTVLRRAPGEKGGSIEDSLILEHYVALVRNVRASGFSERCIFITSNKEDFGTAGNPKPDIAADLTPISLEYVSDLSRAEQALRLMPAFAP